MIIASCICVDESKADEKMIYTGLPRLLYRPHASRGIHTFTQFVGQPAREGMEGGEAITVAGGAVVTTAGIDGAGTIPTNGAAGAIAISSGTVTVVSGAGDCEGVWQPAIPIESRAISASFLRAATGAL